MRKGFGFHNRHSPFRFNPATLFIGGAIQGAFYDFSDLSTMFQDAAGAIPVTAVGDSVGCILDKSGNGNHATQSSAASRPLLQQTNGLYHLTFDGSNNSLLTGSINFTGTNKMTVLSGLSKLSDSGLGLVVELSANAGTNFGSFFLAASRTGAADFGYRSTGTALQDATSATSFASPFTAVLTGISDIAAPAATLRVNGSQAASSTGSQGSGNFGNYPLYIGRRNNASLPFNGRLYGLIVLGAAASDWQIAAAERWMAQRTGISII